MVELTDREKKIIHAIFIMLNPNLNDVPFRIKDGLIRAAFLMRGLEFTEEDMTDIVQAIKIESSDILKNALGFLDKHGDMFKGLKKL